MARRQHLALTVALALAIFFAITYLFSGPSSLADPIPPPQPPAAAADAPLQEIPRGSSSDSHFVVDLNAVPAGVLEGDSIAPKLENATLK